MENPRSNDMKIIKISLIILTAAVLSGCDGRPHHIVHSNATMVIYNAKEVKRDKGIYEYWVTDATSNWVFLSNTKFIVGDIVKIVKIKEKEDNNN